MNIQELNDTGRCDVTVMGYIDEVSELVELPASQDLRNTKTVWGDEVTKHYMATGFKWTHPNGAVISANVDTPILVATVYINGYGDVIDKNIDELDFTKAAKAKLGKISELVWFDFDFEPMDE